MKIFILVVYLLIIVVKTLLGEAVCHAKGRGLEEGRHITTEVLTKFQWEELGELGQRSLFKRKNVLIKGMVPSSLTGMSDFNMQEMSKIVDIFAQLQARGEFFFQLRLTFVCKTILILLIEDCTELPTERSANSHSSYRMVRSSLYDFVREYTELREMIRKRKGPSNYPSFESRFRCLNFLDIPVADDVFRV